MPKYKTMRYFTFEQPGGSYEPDTVTMSEEDIRKEYYPHWYSKMCKKFGKEHVDQTYSFEECLEDWKLVHGAWEVDNKT